MGKQKTIMEIATGLAKIHRVKDGLRAEYMRIQNSLSLCGFCGSQPRIEWELEEPISYQIKCTQCDVCTRSGRGVTPMKDWENICVLIGPQHKSRPNEKAGT